MHRLDSAPGIEFTTAELTSSDIFLLIFGGLIHIISLLVVSRAVGSVNRDRGDDFKIE